MARRMEALNKITVAQSELIAAVSALPKMKRGPRGSFGNKIPKDTLFYAVDGQFIVSTPAMRSTISMTGNWSVCISIDAKRLALVCSKLKANDVLQLSYIDES